MELEVTAQGHAVARGKSYSNLLTRQLSHSGSGNIAGTYTNWMNSQDMMATAGAGKTLSFAQERKFTWNNGPR